MKGTTLTNNVTSKNISLVFLRSLICQNHLTLKYTHNTPSDKTVF